MVSLFLTKMVENGSNNPRNHQAFNASVDVLQQGGSKSFDDDGRPKRTGTVWTASAHIITAVIYSGVLSLPWAIAQLGWIAALLQCFCFQRLIRWQY